MKRKILKRMTGLLLCAALIGSMTACGNKEASGQTTAPAENAAEGDGASAESGEKVTITLWSQFSDPNSTDGNYVAFYNALESIQEDMPNVEVVHEGTESESYKVKLKTAMAGNELPDVFFNWGAGTMKPYVDAGLVLPLDEYMTDEVKAKILNVRTGAFLPGRDYEQRI